MKPRQDKEKRKKRKKILNESSAPITKKRTSPRLTAATHATKAVAEDSKLISPCNAAPKVNGSGNSTAVRSILQGVDMIANSNLSHSNVIADSPHRDNVVVTHDQGVSEPTVSVAKDDEANKVYAYVDEDDPQSLKIAEIVDKNTSHQTLGRVMTIQKKRNSKKQSILAMYEVERLCDHDKDTVRIIRRLEDADILPFSFNAGRKKNKSKHIILDKAGQIMKEEIERAGISILDDSQACIAKNSNAKNLKMKLHFPLFVDPTIERFRFAHAAIERFLPLGDCEPFHSVKVAKKYYDHFRPEKVKVILLAESHAYGDDERISRNGPIIGYENVPSCEYDGPRDFVALVYCLAYGEEDILENRLSGETMVMSDALKSQGTPQFWKLFAACAGEKRSKDGSYGGKVLKSKTSITERMKNKLDILKRLKDRGIWLIDTSIVAWYITQPTEYNITQKSKNVHKLEKNRPPSNMKRNTLVLSWELYIKHEVHKAAKEGHLKLFVPIGREVEEFITQERFVDALTVKNSEGPNCDIYKIPAPNAWIRGKNGLDNILESLAMKIDNVICATADENNPKPVSEVSKL